MKTILILFVCVSTGIGYFITPSNYVRTPLGDGIDVPKMKVLEVGVNEIFLEDASGIVDVPVTVSKAFHETFIKINEEGATAGAFTAQALINRGGGDDVILPPVKFTVDHPFLYAIFYEDKIIFAGTYSE